MPSLRVWTIPELIISGGEPTCDYRSNEPRLVPYCWLRS